MSFRKRHVKNRICKIKPKESIFKKLWFWIGVLSIIIISTTFYFIFFYSGLQAKKFEVSGNNKISAQELENIILSYTNTGLVKFWNFSVTTKSILLVDTEKIRKEILDKFPVIEKVTVSKEYPQTIILGVLERKPFGVFCSMSSELGQDGDCFLIDQNGIAFESLNVIPGGFIIVQQIGDHGQVFTGEQAVAQNITDAIFKIQKSLKDNFQIDLEQALVTTPVRMNIKTSEKWQIYFDMSQNANIDSQLTKLNLLLEQEISRDARKSLRYINLIPKDRAIICDNIECET
jgi:cell division septal protein FtsQ